jgi:hypothetical protein
MIHCKVKVNRSEIGWSESKDGKTIRHAGILDRFKVSREDCEALIINARVKAGWIGVAAVSQDARSADWLLGLVRAADDVCFGT